MELVKTDEVIAKRGRAKAPNQFDNPDTIKMLLTGDTFRITLKDGEKPHAIVNQLREVADNHNHKVSVALDSGTAKLTEAKTFRVKLVKRDNADSAPATTEPAQSTQGKKTGARKR